MFSTEEKNTTHQEMRKSDKIVTTTYANNYSGKKDNKCKNKNQKNESQSTEGQT